MSILDNLATSLGRRDEIPNIELARQIADTENILAIETIVGALSNKKLQNDCIKVLYEIGYLKPELIAPFLNDFIMLLASKNNRLQWGGMCAIATFAKPSAAEVFEQIAVLENAANFGSVITRDNYVRVLLALYGFEEYRNLAFEKLLNTFASAPENQLPMYAEMAAEIIGSADILAFKNALNSRLPTYPDSPKKKRIEKVLKKISKL